MTVDAHIDHTGGRIAWRESGAGRPVIFLHGLGGTRTAWGAQLRGLSDEFRCIAWDMPGYGDSEPLALLTYESIADALAAFIDERELDKPDLVGLSFGGMHGATHRDSSPGQGRPLGSRRLEPSVWHGRYDSRRVDGRPPCSARPW